MKNLLLILLPLLVGSVAVAGPKVQQINKSSDQIAVVPTKETTIGSEWVVTQSSGTQCVFEVVQTSTRSAVLETNDCDLNQLRIGQTIEKSLFSTASAGNQSKTSSNGPAWMKKLDGFSLIGFYSFSDELKYTRQTVDVTGGSDSAFGFGAEYEQNLAKATQGLPMSIIGGLTYELTRELKSENSVNLPGKKPNFSLWTAYVNAAYNITDSISPFAGMNYSFPVESDFQNYNIKSDIGYQLGLSAQLTQNVAVDGLYRWINIKGSADLEEISLDGLTVRGRYVF